MLNDEGLLKQNIENQIIINTLKAPIDYIQEYSEPLPPLTQLSFNPTPWLLINWPALNDVKIARQLLNQNGLPIKSERQLKNYSTASKYLYPFQDLKIEDPYTWGWYIATKNTDPRLSESGHIFVFPEDTIEDYDLIFKAKQILRKELPTGIIPISLNMNGIQYNADFRSCHSPDLNRLPYETNVMLNFSDAIEP